MGDHLGEVFAVARFSVTRNEVGLLSGLEAQPTFERSARFSGGVVFPVEQDVGVHHVLHDVRSLAFDEFLTGIGPPTLVVQHGIEAFVFASQQGLVDILDLPVLALEEPSVETMPQLVRQARDGGTLLAFEVGSDEKLVRIPHVESEHASGLVDGVGDLDFTVTDATQASGRQVLGRQFGDSLGLLHDLVWEAPRVDEFERACLPNGVPFFRV